MQFPKGQRPYPPELTVPLVNWHQWLGLPNVEVESQTDRDGNPMGEKIVTIEPAEDGGRCAPDCHKPQRYRRSGSGEPSGDSGAAPAAGQ